MWFRFWLDLWLWIRHLLVADGLGHLPAYRCRGNNVRLAGPETRRPILDGRCLEVASMVVVRSNRFFEAIFSDTFSQRYRSFDTPAQLMGVFVAN